MTNIVDVQPESVFVGQRVTVVFTPTEDGNALATLPSGMSHDAFISYSHAADGRIAPAVERGLQRLAKPWNRLRAVSVFRDESDLALTPRLWTTISTALDGSRYFILLACPESAASIWVNREVAHWCDTKGTEHLLVVVTGGELAWDPDGGDFSEGSTAVPAALRGRFSEEPLYLDLRWARDVPELSLRLSRFRAAIAQIAAPIRGVPPDELEGEDIRLHRRARLLARAAVATVAVLAVVAIVAAIIAVGNARRADRRAREALGRQLGLAALDLPAGELDEAFLLSLAAADLQGDDDASRFQASRALIGRYSRLEALLHPAEGATRGSQLPRGRHRAGRSDRRHGMVAGRFGRAAVVGGWARGAAIGRGRPCRLLPVGRIRRRHRADRDRGDGRAGGRDRRRRRRSHRSGSTSSTLDLAGGRALVLADDGTLDLVDVADGERIVSTSVAPVDGAEGDAPLSDLSADRVVVASAGRIVLLDSNDGAELASVDDATRWWRSRSARPTARRCSAPSADGTIRTWRRDADSLVAGDADRGARADRPAAAARGVARRPTGAGDGRRRVGARQPHDRYRRERRAGRHRAGRDRSFRSVRGDRRRPADGLGSDDRTARLRRARSRRTRWRGAVGATPTSRASWSAPASRSTSGIPPAGAPGPARRPDQRPGGCDLRRRVDGGHGRMGRHGGGVEAGGARSTTPVGSSSLRRGR